MTKKIVLILIGVALVVFTIAGFRIYSNYQINQQIDSIVKAASSKIGVQFLVTTKQIDAVNQQAVQTITNSMLEISGLVLQLNQIDVGGRLNAEIKKKIVLSYLLTGEEALKTIKVCYADHIVLKAQEEATQRQLEDIPTEESAITGEAIAAYKAKTDLALKQYEQALEKQDASCQKAHSVIARFYDESKIMKRNFQAGVTANDKVILDLLKKLEKSDQPDGLKS